MFHWLLKRTEAVSVNELEGKKLNYLIGNDDPILVLSDDEIVEVGYGKGDPGVGIAIGYCNFFDELNTGEYAPYLNTSDTAEQYHEGEIDPDGAGWDKNLREQFDLRRLQGFKYIELDNPDAYGPKAVLRAYDLAASYGFKIIAKNVEICDDPEALLKHPAVVGCVVERNSGSPVKTDALRILVGKPNLPVWFVSFGTGKAWGVKTAKEASAFKNMSVSYSKDGEYTSSVQL